MQTAEKIRNRLFSLRTRGIRYGLERVMRAAARMDDPHNSCPCIHVAGTNGKGSVCAFLESGLRRLGFTTGLYTSPHLVAFEERFLINGRPVSEESWIAVYEEIQPLIDEQELTFFEVATLMAFELFRRAGVEWAIYETGLGGRLDATNIVMPRVSIITSLALDHEEYLGKGLAAVAGEKLGIIKHRTPVVMALPESDEVRSLAMIHAIRNETDVAFVSPDQCGRYAEETDAMRFIWHGQEFVIRLPGVYQLLNAQLAVSALRSAGFFNLQAVAQGFVQARLPGRFQIETVGGKTVVFDVNHNPHSAQAFCSELRRRFPGRSIVMVVGIMKDKDIPAMLSCYASVSRHLLFAAPATDRAAQAHGLRAALPREYDGKSETAGAVSDAFRLALDGHEEVVCVTGSFFTVGEAMACAGIRPYA
ncbi:MAG: bifunctional folylpolyglutamate synthase/dihydrofolate synthase [Chitinispirillaceae bacterium]|nr:bifunctional folylpolyglutamate synthase/dihydrofolate synthase [Chitinispirillaceae bacterium]